MKPEMRLDLGLICGARDCVPVCTFGQICLEIEPMEPNGSKTQKLNRHFLNVYLISTGLKSWQGSLFLVSSGKGSIITFQHVVIQVF